MDSNFGGVVHLVNDVVFVVVGEDVLVDVDFALDDGPHASSSSVDGGCLLSGVDGNVVVVAICVCHVVCHVVWSYQVDCNAFVCDAVVGVGQRDLTRFLRRCFVRDEEDVDHVGRVCPCEVADSKGPG